MKNRGKVQEKIYSILTFPFVFNTYQYLIGANEFMKKYVNDYICPFPGAKILDVGCGTAPVLKYLPENIEYIGYDSNPLYIKNAEIKYKNRGVFYCQSTSEYSNIDLESFDIVLAGAILHHINDEEAKDLFKKASDLLKVGGYLVTYDGVYVNNQSRIARYILSKDRGMFVRTSEQYLDLAKSGFCKIDSFIINDMYKIPYTGLIMKCYKQ